MYAKIEAWQCSGLSQNKYSEQEGINLCVFKYWLSKYRLEQAMPVQVKEFVPIQVEKAEYPSVGELTITYPNGVRLSGAGLNQEFLQLLINLPCSH